jgi:hypothetical protein
MAERPEALGGDFSPELTTHFHEALKAATAEGRWRHDVAVDAMFTLALGCILGQWGKRTTAALLFDMAGRIDARAFAEERQAAEMRGRNALN